MCALSFARVIVIAMRILGFTCVVIIAVRILGFTGVVVIAVRIFGFTGVVIITVRICQLRRHDRHLSAGLQLLQSSAMAFPHCQTWQVS